jgi:hypothetical protein
MFCKILKGKCQLLILVTVVPTFAEIEILTPKEICEKRSEVVSKIENLQLSMEEAHYFATNQIARTLDVVKSRWPKQYPRATEQLGDGMQYGYSKLNHKRYFENRKNGSLRLDIAEESPSSDSEQAVLKGNKTTFVWHNGKYVDYLESVDMANAVATINTEPINDIMRLQSGLIYHFDDKFYQELNKAIQSDQKISVEIEDGILTVAFPGEYRYIQGKIDPNKGYAVIEWTKSQTGKLTARYSATYDEVAKDIWIPTEGRIESFDPDENALKSKAKYLLTEYKINDPNFDNACFEFTLPDGTHVSDMRTGISYIVGDPTSKRVDMVGSSPQNIVR